MRLRRPISFEYFSRRHFTGYKFRKFHRRQISSFTDIVETRKFQVNVHTDGWYMWRPWAKSWFFDLIGQKSHQRFFSNWARIREDQREIPPVMVQANFFQVGSNQWPLLIISFIKQKLQWFRAKAQVKIISTIRYTYVIFQNE